MPRIGSTYAKIGRNRIRKGKPRTAEGKQERQKAQDSFNDDEGDQSPAGSDPRKMITAISYLPQIEGKRMLDTTYASSQYLLSHGLDPLE